MKLNTFEVSPVASEPDYDSCILVCDICNEQLANPKRVDPNHWRCLNKSMWSETAIVQAQAIHMLRQLAPNHDWAADLDEMAYLLHEISLVQILNKFVEGSQFDRATISELVKKTSAEQIQLFYQIVIKGQDFDKMTNLAQDIKYYVDEIDEISYTRLNYSESAPEAKLSFDQHLMGIYGITPSMIASELNSFNNQTSTTSVFKDGNDTYTINIKDEEADRLEKLKQTQKRDIDDLKKLVIQGSNKSNLNFGRAMYCFSLQSNSSKQLKICLDEISIFVSKSCW